MKIFKQKKLYNTDDLMILKLAYLEDVEDEDEEYEYYGEKYVDEDQVYIGKVTENWDFIKREKYLEYYIFDNKLTLTSKDKFPQVKVVKQINLKRILAEPKEKLSKDEIIDLEVFLNNSIYGKENILERMFCDEKN